MLNASFEQLLPTCWPRDHVTNGGHQQPVPGVTAMMEHWGLITNVALLLQPIGEQYYVTRTHQPIGEQQGWEWWGARGWCLISNVSVVTVRILEWSARHTTSTVRHGPGRQEWQTYVSRTHCIGLIIIIISQIWMVNTWTWCRECCTPESNRHPGPRHQESAPPRDSQDRHCYGQPQGRSRTWNAEH